MARPERAVLFLPTGSALPGTALFGLQPVERSALALLRAGVRELVVTGDAEAAARAVRLLETGRCRAAAPRLVPVEGHARWLSDDEATLLVRGDFWFDRPVGLLLSSFTSKWVSPSSLPS